MSLRARWWRRVSHMSPVALCLLLLSDHLPQISRSQCLISGVFTSFLLSWSTDLSDFCFHKATVYQGVVQTDRTFSVKRSDDVFCSLAIICREIRNRNKMNIPHLVNQETVCGFCAVMRLRPGYKYCSLSYTVAALCGPTWRPLCNLWRQVYSVCVCAAVVGTLQLLHTQKQNIRWCHLLF